MLTHWLPIINILLLKEAIYCNIFWCNYLRNEKDFSFLAFSKFRFYTEHFQEKNDRHSCGIFELTDWVSVRCLDKYIKGSVSEDPSTSNMVNGPKHCTKLNDSTFTILIHPCEANSGWKSLSKWYAKSWDSLLTQWCPRTSIFFLIETIYRYVFRCNYLKKEKYYLNFLLHFINLD